MQNRQPIGENIIAYTEGGKLILEIDLGVSGTPSASGKSTVLASTRGNTTVAGVSVGLNVYRKRNGGSLLGGSF